jgi:hypothetical protein
MAENSTLQALLIELGLLVQPLAEAAEVEPIPTGIIELAEEAGIDLNSLLVDPTPVTQFAVAIGTLYEEFRAVVESQVVSVEDVPKLIRAAQNLFNAIQMLDSLQIRPDVDVGALEIGQALASYLMIRHLKTDRRGIYQFLELIGAVGEWASGNQTIPFVDFSYLPKLLTKPDQLFKSLYKWGERDVDLYLFLIRLNKLLFSLGIPSVFQYPEAKSALTLGSDPQQEQPDQQLRIPLFVLERDGKTGQAGMALLPLPPTQSDLPGLAVIPFGAGNVSETIPLGQQWQFVMKVSTDGSIDFGLSMRPNRIAVVRLDGAGAYSEFHAEATIKRANAAETKMPLFVSDGLRLELGTVGLGGGFDLKNGDADITIMFMIEKSVVLLKRQETDGFLQKLLPPEGLRSEFDLSLGLSNKRGFFFKGGAGLEIDIPVHRTLLNILTIDFVHLVIRTGEPEPSQPQINLTAAVTAILKLGPIEANAERVGLNSTIAFPPDQQGNLGIANFELGFKPPTGIGLAIDAAGIIKGGGYLSADHAKGEYAGILALTIKETISLKAIAILTVTKPGQPANFSLFVLITAEFTSIPIGFGFTLNGIGGLFAVNRRMAIEALQAGVKTNALDSILFPQNPVANAPTILNNIRNFFPIEQGRFVFGLMVKIGWGTPTLLTIQAGIVLELPDPWKLVIMGQARIVLPNPEKPLVDLRMTVLGYIDTARSELGIDATLSGSRILTFSVSGDMLLRIRWGNDFLFVVSLGGFHHKFQPPPGLPKMDRMAISLADGDNPRIRLEAYLAITSNTVQFGANFDLYAGVSIWLVGKFSVSAYLGFDALFQFNPFYFIIEIRAGLSLCHNDRPVLAVKLFFELSGPNPWNANGYAEFHFIVSVRIGFNITIGKKKPELPRPIVNVQSELLAALANPANWSSAVAGNAPVKFREINSGNTVLVNPMVPLTVRQRVLPLNHRLDKFGESQPNVAGPFTIKHITSSGIDILGKQGTPRDYFAPAQFFNFSNDEKLAQPNFEQFDCGAVTDAGSTVGGAFGTYLEVDVSYETAVIDHEDQVDTQLYIPWLSVVRDTLHLGAAGQATLRTTGSAAFAGPDRGVVVVDMAYVVVERATMMSPQAVVHTTYIAARVSAQNQPGQHVVGAHELMKPEG